MATLINAVDLTQELSELQKVTGLARGLAHHQEDAHDRRL
jgi:hypothetical protein